MKRTVNASYYMAEGEKYNPHVSALISVKCPDCFGDGKIEIEPPLDESADFDYMDCDRCGGDGLLTNKLTAHPDLPICASNLFRKGWLKVTYKDKSIYVFNCDTMAEWLNSENGKWTKVCKSCHSRSYMNIGGMNKCICGGEFIKVREIDLAYSAFGKLADHKLGIIQVEVEEI